MSENSLPRADNHDEKVESFLRTLRATGREMLADAYQSWFSWDVLFIDTSGRIMEAGAPSTTKEAP